MTAAQTKAARRKTILRYGKSGRSKTKTVAESIADERRKAAREAASKIKKK